MASFREVERDFTRLIKEQSLSHGYIFFGEAQDKQFIFAQKLAYYLESGRWSMRKPERAPKADLSPRLMGLGRTPLAEKAYANISEGLLIDVLIISGDGDSIGIESVREAINFLWLKPLKSPKKTLIINNADKLTNEAQNALLKISEEPPEHSLMILVLKDPGVLAFPLVSRFQKIYFSKQCEEYESYANDAKNLAKEFFGADYKERKEIIKVVIEDSQTLADFVKSLIAELRRDPIKNHHVLKELLGRWQLINQYNVNKKLQLEAALLEL